MLRRKTIAALTELSLNREDGVSYQSQLFRHIRDLILSQRLPSGTRLPSTRDLAREVGCSRNTVVEVFEQLIAEGYLEARRGSGTSVSTVLPDELLSIAAPDAKAATSPTTPVRPSLAGAYLTRAAHQLVAHKLHAARRLGAFDTGLPETSCFPFDVWSRLVRQIWTAPRADLIADVDPAGHLGLRRVLADYLRLVRGLDCNLDNIVITSGTTHSINLLCRLFADVGDKVWLEEPGSRDLRATLLSRQLDVVPVPVDVDGLNVDAAITRARAARIAFVTPSHQYPTGHILSLPRRLQLLEWARDNDALIVEDDYDSEFRYAGRPLSALQALDQNGRVIYCGTFTKTTFPNIRLGYIVASREVAAMIADARYIIDYHTPVFLQPVLARFIEDGYMAAHVRRLRKLYEQRQEALIKAVARHADGLLTAQPDPAGMHVIAAFTPAVQAAGLSDDAAAVAIGERGVVALPLSTYYMEAPAQYGFLLGYGGTDEDQIERGIALIADVMRAQLAARG